MTQRNRVVASVAAVVLMQVGCAPGDGDEGAPNDGEPIERDASATVDQLPSDAPSSGTVILNGPGQRGSYEVFEPVRGQSGQPEEGPADLQLESVRHPPQVTLNGDHENLVLVTSGLANCHTQQPSGP